MADLETNLEKLDLQDQKKEDQGGVDKVDHRMYNQVGGAVGGPGTIAHFVMFGWH